MYRVYVAWDSEDARRFLALLRGHGIDGRVIEDREFPARGELHDAETSAEVWIGDPDQLDRALDLASSFESSQAAHGSA